MSEIKILFFAANPRSTTKLMLDEEIRAITHNIRASDYRYLLKLESFWATRPDDLLQELNLHRPQIVHFSGHGSQEGQIILVDDRGLPKLVSTQAIKQLFTTLKDNIQVIILNACYSRTQANAIIEVIDCVIGMNDAIGDQAATIFAASFYRAIGFGRSVQEAFDQGKTALLLEGIPEDNTPELLVKEGVNPSLVFLTVEQKNGGGEDTRIGFASNQPHSQSQVTEEQGKSHTNTPRIVPHFNDEAEPWILEGNKHLERGNTNHDVQSYEYALDAYQQALSRNPYNAVAHESIGNMYLYFENYDMALEAYNHSLYIDPRNPAVYLSKGNLLQQLERYDEALETYEHGIRIDSNYSVLYENQGDLLWWLGRDNEALVAYFNKSAALWRLQSYRESVASYFVWLGKKLLTLKVSLEGLKDMMSRSEADDQE